MRMILLSLVALVACVAAHADVVASVTINTTSLIGHPAGPFSIAFELADGSGFGDGNNAVFLSNFGFGAGGPSGLPLTFGSVGGDLSSSVVMTDAAAANIFVQSFVPGSTLSFSLDTTTNLDAGGAPDEFIMSILDNTFAPIPTTSPSPLSPLLEIDIDLSNPTVQVFSSDQTRRPAGGGGPISISQPVVSGVPEPSMSILGPMLVLCFVSLKWRRAAQIRRSPHSRDF